MVGGVRGDGTVSEVLLMACDHPVLAKQQKLFLPSLALCRLLCLGKCSDPMYSCFMLMCMYISIKHIRVCLVVSSD